MGAKRLLLKLSANVANAVQNVFPLGRQQVQLDGQVSFRINHDLLKNIFVEYLAWVFGAKNVAYMSLDVRL